MTKRIYFNYDVYCGTNALPYPTFEDGEYKILMMCEGGERRNTMETGKWKDYEPVIFEFDSEESFTKWQMMKEHIPKFFDTMEECMLHQLKSL